MIKTSVFQQVIECVETLSLEDQEILLDILQKRLSQEKRVNLSQEIAEIRQEFAQGKVQFGSVDQFLAEIDGMTFISRKDAKTQRIHAENGCFIL